MARPKRKGTKKGSRITAKEPKASSEPMVQQPTLVDCEDANTVDGSHVRSVVAKLYGKSASCIPTRRTTCKVTWIRGCWMCVGHVVVIEPSTSSGSADGEWCETKLTDVGLWAYGTHSVMPWRAGPLQLGGSGQGVPFWTVCQGVAVLRLAILPSFTGIVHEDLSLLIGIRRMSV